MSIILIILLALLVPAVGLAGPGPNAPSGIQTLIDEPWNAFNNQVNQQANGWINNYIGCNASVVQDGSAPESPPNLLRQARAAGSANGGCSISKYFTNTPVNRVYGRIRFRTSNPFYGVAAGGAKLIGYVQHQGGNFVLLDMNNAVSGSQWVFSSAIYYQNQCHLLGQPGVYIPIPSECTIFAQLFQNTGNSSNIIAGQWQDIEWIYDNGSCSTCRDGKIIAWNNGVRVLDFQNVNMPATPFVSWTVTHTWDGQPMENINVASHFDFDQMYLGTYGGTVGPGDTTPPGQVQNFTVIQTN